MSKTEEDPAGTTQQFRAYMAEGRDDSGAGARTGLVVAGVVVLALLVVVVLVALLH